MPESPNVNSSWESARFGEHIEIEALTATKTPLRHEWRDFIQNCSIFNHF